MAAIGVVLLHPLGLERVDPQRVGQVHTGPNLLARVHRPVSVVCGLQDDLGVRASSRQQPLQLLGAIVDPVAREHFAICVHPDRH